MKMLDSSLSSAEQAKTEYFAASGGYQSFTPFLIKPYENQCHKNRVETLIDYPENSREFLKFSQKFPGHQNTCCHGGGIMASRLVNPSVWCPRW